jgi:predicted dehydrogenase
LTLPSSSLYLFSLQALRAGKHVLCEKPLGSNHMEAEQMKIAAEESGKVSLLHHPLALLPYPTLVSLLSLLFSLYLF